MNRIALAFLLIFSSAFRITAQQHCSCGLQKPSTTLLESSNYRIFDSPGDTVKRDTTQPKVHSPKKAALMSAIVPGLGQIYNRKYWKLAIIYPAMGGLAYGIGWNHKYFKVYRDALRIRYDGDSTTVDQYPLYSDDRIVTMKNYYQRYRDLCVIGMSAVYVLQIIDASVDAHLFNFDVGPDLSFEWRPEFRNTAYGSDVGVTCTLHFRK